MAEAGKSARGSLFYARCCRLFAIAFRAVGDKWVGPAVRPYRWPVGVIVDFDVQICERGDRIDPACGKEDKAGMPALAGFDQVDGTAEIVLNELAGTGFAIDSSKDAGIGGCINDPIKGAEGFKVGGDAEVTVQDLDGPWQLGGHG